MRAPYSYFGGKSRLASRLLPLMPPHRVYVEPFFGSGAVFFAKKPAHHEIINDVSRNVVTFLRVLRDQPAELERVCALTPHARDEFLAADLEAEDLDDLERARRFWVRVNQSFAQAVNTSTGWSLTIARTQSRPATIAGRVARFGALAERLMSASIDNRDAVDVIESAAGSGTLIYADPPYLSETRVMRRGSAGDYEHDMADQANHRRLIAALRCTTSKVMISGYPSTLYDELLADWHSVDMGATSSTSNSRRSTRGARVERVWMNYEPPGRLAFHELAEVDA